MSLFVQPDLKFLHRLHILQKVCLSFVTATALCVLCGWFFPLAGGALPSGWSTMSAGTALAVLLSAAALALSPCHGAAVARRAGKVPAAALLALALTAAWLHVRHHYAHAHALGLTGSMQISDLSALALASFLLLAVVVLFISANAPLLSAAVDAAAFVLCLLVVMIVAEDIYGAMHLLHLPADTESPPLTVFSLALLTFVAFSRRAECGIFSILLGTGIGSRIARVICPCAFLLPFVRETIRALTIYKGWTVPEYSTVVATAVAAMLAFALILFMSLRISTLEKRLHELSLRDSLTGLYNRRGFYLFAEQALWLAHRAQKPFSVLYIDLDGLKHINDKFGHETGSAFITEVADLLQKTFRETDAFGRIGGDEFAIAGDWDATRMLLIAQRLEAAVIQRNAQAGRAYQIHFCLGLGTSTPGENETLEGLLHRADEAMYKIKQQKKSASSSR